MTASQAAAWQQLSPRYLIDELPRQAMESLLAPQPPLDFELIFGRPAPLLVEIGVGSGENLAAAALAHPDWNLLGFEVYDKVIGSAMLRLAEANVSNARLISGDAVTGLQHLLAPGSVTEVQTYFPDPWPKARHAKRRLISIAFAELVASRLLAGGHWRLATDWPDYAAQISSVLSRCSDFFTDLYPGGAPRDISRPLTRFEGRAIDEGRSITDFVFRRTELEVMA